MVLFRACPRCGGDVDTTYWDDAFCVQCGYRPKVVYPGPRVLNASHGGYEENMSEETLPVCYPKCGSRDHLKLEKLRAEDNTCLRCRRCGHIFSPGALRTPDKQAV